jgi:flagellar biogenesis protein FliO
VRALVVSALAASVTALSILANPLTAGVARAEGTDSAPSAASSDEGSDAKPRHHHHHDDAKDAKDGKATAAKTSAVETPATITPPAAAADAPATAPSAVTPAQTAPAVVPVTPPAQAAQTTPPPAASTSTPLSLVPSKPLELSTEAPTSNLGWKLGAMGVLAAAGFWAYSKKKSARIVASTPIPEMRILRRTSIGVRSELLLVDLEGQRILLGVTPSNIQSLLIVPDSAMSEPVPVEEPVAPVARASRERETVRESGSLRTMPSMSMLMNQIERERTEGSVAQRLPRDERSVAQRAPRTEGSVAQRLPRTEGSVSQRLPREEGSASFPKRRPSVADFNLNTEEALEGQAEGLLALRRSR